MLFYVQYKDTSKCRSPRLFASYFTQPFRVNTQMFVDNNAVVARMLKLVVNLTRHHESYQFVPNARM